MKTSLISVTFRKKSPEEIADLACRAGLDAIEWAGDSHVPPNDPEAAEKALQLCRDRGLEVSAYGSYYRSNDSEDFAAIMDTAVRLQTKIIRVWAGNGFAHSAQCGEAYRAEVVRNLRRAVAMAAEHGCIVATERHANTLTDCQESALQLLKEVPGLYTYWQPSHKLNCAENTANIIGLGKAVRNVHVYHRDHADARMPLADGIGEWKTYLKALRDHTDTGYVGLEFVLGNSEAQYFADCQVLHALMKDL